MIQLSICMIVKNEENYLKECLESVHNIADEIVIVDTGSTDKTISIANEYNAKVLHFNWINDFSAARNFALRNSSGKWILYIDADERLDSGSIAELKKIIEKDSLSAYYCTVMSYDSEGNRDNSLKYTRLFFNSPGIEFVGKVHEQIGDSLVKCKYKLLNSNILIHHVGYNISKEEKQKKALRNLTLLKEEYKIKKTGYCSFQLAQTYSALEEQENARKYFKIAGDSVDLEISLRAQCFASLSLIAHNSNKTIESEELIQLSLKLDSRQPFSQLLASKIALRRGDHLIAEEKCRIAYSLNQKKSLEKDQSNLSVILDPEEVIFFGLTIALQNQNSINVGFYQKELSAYYNRKECKNGPQKLMVVQKLFSCSQLNATEEKILIDLANRYTLNLLLYLLVNNPHKQQVFDLANNLLQKFPDSIEISKMAAKLLEEFGKLEEAIQILEDVVKKEQYDPSILFYLISFYLKNGTKEKVRPMVLMLESKYSDVSEIMERVIKLKEKLSVLMNIHF